MPAIERQGDTVKSYAALCDYFAMGAGRSLSLLAKAYRDRHDLVPTKQESRLGYWSAKYHWQERVKAADDAQRAQEDAARAQVRAERRIELEEADWADGAAGRQRMREILAEIPKFTRRAVNRIERVDPQTGQLTITEVITLAISASPDALMRALKTASDLQRLSVGEPTEQIDSNQTIEIRYVNDQPDDEAPA